MSQTNRVLVVGAHPDDPEFLFGAAIARLLDAGATAAYVICTDGCQGSEDPTIPDAELSATRQAEQLDAAAALGVTDVTFLAYRDGSLAPTIELRRAITREIRRFRPDLVLTHAPARMLSADIGFSHPDHLAAGEAALSAVDPDARSPRMYPELLREGLVPHLVEEIWVPGVEDADHFVDATGVIDRKVAAVLRHRSQFQDYGVHVEQWVRDRARQVGELAGYQYAERFKRIRSQ